VAADDGRTLALTVHGPSGVVDLVVPPEALVDDVAREYAAQCRLQFTPRLHSRAGLELGGQQPLTELGVRSGDVLAVGGAIRRPVGGAGSAPTAHPEPGGFSATWFAVAVGVAGLAAWSGARTGFDDPSGRLTAGLLALAALVGVLPVGRLGGHRMAAAPAFAGAAAFVVVWAPGPERLPTIVGVTGLVAAVAAGIARALDVRADEALRVWIVVGGGLFVVTGAGALLRTDPQVVWAVLLLAATLAARFVPGLAIDVPDQFLVDLERLAVSAWSARERPSGRRDRTAVPPAAVARVATRGGRIVTAAAVAVLAVTAVSAPMPLATATLSVDRVGADVMVGLSGVALVLAARSYRHCAARTALRAAGLACWSALAVVEFREVAPGAGLAVGIGGILVAVVLLVVAVATGRGWRSAWWSRRAEVAEALAGAGTIAALVVASGLFRTLWEVKFRV